MNTSSVQVGKHFNSLFLNFILMKYMCSIGIRTKICLFMLYRLECMTVLVYISGKLLTIKTFVDDVAGAMYHCAKVYISGRLLTALINIFMRGLAFSISLFV